MVRIHCKLPIIYWDFYLARGLLRDYILLLARDILIKQDETEGRQGYGC